MLVIDYHHFVLFLHMYCDHIDVNYWVLSEQKFFYA